MAAGIKQNLHFRHINSKQFQRRGSESRRVKDIGGRPIMVVPPNMEPNLCCSLRGREAFGGKDGGDVSFGTSGSADRWHKL